MRSVCRAARYHTTATFGRYGGKQFQLRIAVPIVGLVLWHLLRPLERELPSDGTALRFSSCRTSLASRFSIRCTQPRTRAGPPRSLRRCAGAWRGVTDALWAGERIEIRTAFPSGSPRAQSQDGGRGGAASKVFAAFQIGHRYTAEDKRRYLPRRQQVWIGLTKNATKPGMTST